MSLADTFDRADNASAIGTASDGGTWTVHGGVWGIKSNQAYMPSGIGGSPVNAGSDYQIVRRDLGTASADVTVTNVRTSTGGFLSIWFAFNSSTTDGYLVEFTGGTTLNVKRRASGSTSTLSGTGTFTNWSGSSAIIRITYDSASGQIKVYQNGTQVASRTDGSPLTGTWVALGQTGASTTTDQLWNDFSASTFTPPPVPYKPRIIVSRRVAITRATVI